MKYKILLLFLIGLTSFKANHKFYVSVTEVKYNEKEKSLQMISRIFVDDLEDLLQKRYDKTIVLTKGEDKKIVFDYLKKYLEQKITVEVDGKDYKVNYLGKEYDNDTAVIYLEVPGVPHFTSIKIQNAVLADLFPEQKNLVHVEYKGKIKSMVLADGKLEDVLNFNN